MRTFRNIEEFIEFLVKEAPYLSKGRRSQKIGTDRDPTL